MYELAAILAHVAKPSTVSTDWKGFFLIASGVTAALGYMVGQFRSNKSKAVSDALAVALAEAAAMKLRVERLEKETGELRGKLMENSNIIEKLREENEILRTVKISSDIEASLQGSVQAVLRDFLQNVKERHLALAKALPKPLGDALESAMKE